MKQLILIMTLFGMINTASNTNSPIPANLYDISIESLDGGAMDLSQFKGKKILFVNVASKCGFTPQYEDLETLSKTYKDELVVIGIPCNQFGNQEPGSAGEIQEFCQVNFGVTFPLTAKVDVKGKQQHPLYTWLTEKEYNGVKSSSVKWNFQKYLVDEKGQLIDFFGSTTNPLSKKITAYLN
jgi:glutathione peroxidase